MGEGWQWEWTLWLAGALFVSSALVLGRARRHRLPVALAWEGWLNLVGGMALGARLGTLGLEGWVLVARHGIVGTGSETAPDGWQLLWGAPSAQGALLGGGLALLLWAARGRPGWAVADLAAPALLLAAALVAGGAFRLGLGYGLPASGLGTLPAPDGHGLVMTRWAVQPLGALGWVGLALALLALHARGALPEGAGALLGLWAANLLLFVLGFTRGDPGWYVGPLRGEQLGALAWLVAAGLLLPSRWGHKRNAVASSGA